MVEKAKTLLGSLGIVGGIIVSVAIICFPLFLTVVGLANAFMASILLGIIFLIVSPASLVLGVYIIFGGNNWAPELVTWMGLPF